MNATFPRKQPKEPCGYFNLQPGTAGWCMVPSGLHETAPDLATYQLKGRSSSDTPWQGGIEKPHRKLPFWLQREEQETRDTYCPRWLSDIVQQVWRFPAPAMQCHLAASLAVTPCAFFWGATFDVDIGSKPFREVVQVFYSPISTGTDLRDQGLF